MAKEKNYNAQKYNDHPHHYEAIYEEEVVRNSMGGTSIVTICKKLFCTKCGRIEEI